jgi:KDO2-lipid IV(A) lauroyltransferase
MLVRRDRLRWARHLLYVFLARALMSLITLARPRNRLRIGQFLGHLIYLFDAEGRRMALGNLRSSFPDKCPKEISKLSRLCYQNIGMGISEFACLTEVAEDGISGNVSFYGMGSLDKSLSMNKGVVIISAHFGNWELLGAALSARGYTVNVIARRLRVKALDDLVSHVRSKAGVNAIDATNALSAYLSVLRKNQILGVLADIDTKSHGAFVDFLGRPAYTPLGPALMSMRSGAPLIPVFIVRDRESHRVVAGEPIDTSEGAVSAIESYSRILGDLVRRYPDQWIWMHKRWR